MTQAQGNPAPLHCPRCGGLMRKPSGSTLYWHVNNNHPRCDITNIVATILETEATPEAPPPPDPPRPTKGKRNS